MKYCLYACTYVPCNDHTQDRTFCCLPSRFIPSASWLIDGPAGFMVDFFVVVTGLIGWLETLARFAVDMVAGR